MYQLLYNKCTAAKKHKRFSLERLNHIDQIKNKPQGHLVNTSNGNRDCCILQATDQHNRNSTQENMTRIRHVIERRLCTH